MYPGKLFNQQHACYGLCGQDIPWVFPQKKWEKLALEMLDEIKNSNKNILISSEALSCMNYKGVSNFVNKLGGIDEVVLTLRNFHRVMLSGWQQSIKGGGVKSLPEFIDCIRVDRANDKGIWRYYRFGETVSSWSSYAKVTVVVVDNKNEKNELLSTFSSACGIPVMPEPESNSLQENKSLKREDVELLRRFNIMNENMDQKNREAYVRWLLRKGFFPAANLASGSRIKMPKENVEEITMWAQEELSKISDQVVVLGELNNIYEVAKEDIEDTPFDDRFDHLARMNHILKLIFKSASRSS